MAGLSSVTDVGALIVLFVLPGLAVLRLASLDHDLSLEERIGLAGGVGLCIYPVLLLWLHTLGIAAGPPLALAIGGISLLSLTVSGIRNAQWLARPRSIGGGVTASRHADATSLGLYLALSAVLLVTRLSAVKGMVAPAWGDSVHHTFIVQLLLDHAGLFRSWEPYASIETFSYHFGFHANAVAWCWLTGSPAAQAVLVVGQVCNVLAVMALYPLAVRVSGNRWAGLATMVVAGLVFPLPGFFVNWGRYSQLAGLVVLPVVFWAFDRWWVGDPRPSPGSLLLVSLLVSGLGLAHYRLAVLGVAGGAAWSLWGLLCRYRRPREWVIRTMAMAAAGLASALMLTPWLVRVAAGRYREVLGTIEPGAQAALNWQDLRIWTATHLYFSSLFWAAAIVALGWAIATRRHLAGPLVLWLALSFAVVNPFLLGMPGTGWVMNDTLVFTMYIPISLCLGWACGRSIDAGWTVRVLRLPLVAFAVVVLTIGVRSQSRIADPFFQMVTRADLAAFAWIANSTPRDAVFLVNGFVRDDHFVVGSDAGWWLPFYAHRRNTVPPALYHTERLPAAVRREGYVELVEALRACLDRPDAVPVVLSRYGITHVFLGERRGTVAYGESELVAEAWLRSRREFTLLHEVGRAQVWRVNVVARPK